MERSFFLWSLERRNRVRQVLLTLIVGVSLSFMGCATLNRGGDEAVRLKSHEFNLLPSLNGTLSSKRC